MQSLIAYINAQSTLGTCLDESGNRAAVLPGLVRGGSYDLRLRLFSSPGIPMPLSMLPDCAAWQCAFASDYNKNTPPQLSITSGITVSEIPYPQNQSEKMVEICIPITAQTQELITWLGADEAKTINCEIVGEERGTGMDAFILQIKGFSIRNRMITGSTPPSPLPNDYYRAAQIDALFAAGYDVQFSVAGAADDDGHDTQTATDRYYRFRNAASDAALWSPWIAMVAGPAGVDGTNGVDGTDGTNGVDGAPCALTIGTVTTGAPGTAAAAAITGDAPNQVLSLTIPRGTPGTGNGTVTSINGYAPDIVGAVTLPSATPAAAGLLSAADKSRLDGMTTGYLGYYATPAALTAAHPAGTDGEFASVGSTDTIWAWDSDSTSWVNTDSNTINPSWGNISDKPETFPPATHSHEIAGVTGLQAALDGKAAATALAAKQDAITGTAGQVVGFDADGTPIAQDDAGMTAAERARLLPDPSQFDNSVNGKYVEGFYDSGLGGDCLLCTNIFDGMPASSGFIDAAGKCVISYTGSYPTDYQYSFLDIPGWEPKCYTRHGDYTYVTITGLPASIAGDFRIEYRIKSHNGNGTYLFTVPGYTGYPFGYNNGTFRLNQNQTVNLSSVFDLDVNQWIIWRVARQNGVLAIFANGTKLYSAAWGDVLSLGSIILGSGDGEAYIDNVAIYNTCASLDNYDIPTSAASATKGFRMATPQPASYTLNRAIDAIPVQYTAATGYCHYLDATNTTLTLCGNVRNCTALRLYVRSASTVTGNIMLAITCNGTAVKTVTIPVTATDVAQTITFDTAVTGLITITRDTANADDTLADTDKVTAIIGDDIAVNEVSA